MTTTLNINDNSQDFCDSPVVRRLHLLVQAVWVWSLVRELRFHMLRVKKQSIKNKQIVTFNKDLKNGPHKKILKNNS